VASSLLKNLLQLWTVVLLAPFFKGMVGWLEETIQGKVATSPWQPYYDLAKLFRKTQVVSEEASWIFHFDPYISAPRLRTCSRSTATPSLASSSNGRRPGRSAGIPSTAPSTLVGLLLLAVAAGGTGFAELARAARGLPDTARWAAFLLAFLGFEVKAGLFPSMGWLPRAHPAAPANASALLSGVILNLGIYGILRTCGAFLAPLPLAAGLIVLMVGAVTAIIGILYANTANDLKHMLAHSSIENMGLVTVGLGAAFTILTLHQPALAAIAYVASLFHMVNHSLYKSLLFLGVGAVDQSTGTRDMDRLGGLARRMPWTSVFSLAGVLSIAALPPFTAFRANGC